LTQVRVPAGSIAKVRGLAVTNVFGERYWITPAGTGDDDTWQRWSMFSTSLIGPGEADTSLLVLPVVAKVQEGPVLEEVALVRDEMANMVWGLETTVPSGAGGGMPGGLAAGETSAFFARLGAAVPPVDPTEPRVADVRYEVMSSVPEQWIPFVPVHAPGSHRETQLQPAPTPRIARCPSSGAPPCPGTCPVRTARSSSSAPRGRASCRACPPSRSSRARRCCARAARWSPCSRTSCTRRRSRARAPWCRSPSSAREP